MDFTQPTRPPTTALQETVALIAERPTDADPDQLRHHAEGYLAAATGRTLPAAEHRAHHGGRLLHILGATQPGPASVLWGTVVDETRTAHRGDAGPALVALAEAVLHALDAPVRDLTDRAHVTGQPHAIALLHILGAAQTRGRRIVTAAGVAAAALVLAAPPASAVPAQTALAAARAQIGDPYRTGGTGPAAFDCSGLTRYAWARAGVHLPRTAQQQYNVLHHVPAADRRPGDLVFIGRTTHAITHAGVYSGWKADRGWMVNANTGASRGRRVVNAPIREYTVGAPRAYYGRPAATNGR